MPAAIGPAVLLTMRRALVSAAVLLASLASLPAASLADDSGARVPSPSAAGATLVQAAPPAAVRPRDAPPLLYGRTLPTPATGRWRFDVYFGHYRGNFRVASLDYVVDHDGRRYRLRTEGRAEGLTALIYSGVLDQSSVGRLSANGLAPERYAEQRGRRPERWARIDYESRRVAFSGGEVAEIVDGAQDRLSTVIQLGLLVRAMPERFAAGAVFELPEITLRSVERAQYTSRGETSLDTAGGPLRALHLERTAPHHETRFEVWLGYDQGLLPVRIRLTDSGGRVLDQMLAR